MRTGTRRATRRAVTVAVLGLLVAHPVSAQVFEAVMRPHYGPFDLGVQGDWFATIGGISGDGRYTVFGWIAGNVFPDPGTYLYVHDRQTNALSRLGTCLPDIGSSAPTAVSSDGNVIAFVAGAGCIPSGVTNFQRRDVFVYDRSTDTLTRASTGLAGAQPDQDSGSPAISSDGRYVVFASGASNLVAGDSNAATDVFMLDRTVPGVLERVSVGPGGVQGNGFSARPSVSADGRWIAFYSSSTNFFANDTNLRDDVFLRDRQNATTTRVAEGTDPVVSANGAVVVFESGATTLVPGDTNSRTDVFAYEVAGGAITRVSVSTSGAQTNQESSAPAVSADGRYVAFESAASNLGVDANTAYDVFVRDRQLATTTLASVTPAGAGAYRQSFTPMISAEGRYLGFNSDATNLVAGDTNGETDVFVRDLLLGQTSRANLAPSPLPARVNGGAYRSSLSHDGRFVAYESGARNLTPTPSPRFVGSDDIYVTDRTTGATRMVSVTSAGVRASASSDNPAISGDGRFVVFDTPATNLAAGDTNFDVDVFRHEIATGTTVKVSDSDGFDAAISFDGRFVVYSGEFGSNLTIWDAAGGTRAQIGPGGTPVSGTRPALSSDARYVAFESSVSFDPRDTNFGTDIYVLDRATGAFDLVSISTAGALGDATSTQPTISDDGRYVAFLSFARNLAPGDGSFQDGDVFVRDRLAGTTVVLSRTTATIDSYGPAISPDGRYVAFGSDQALVTPDVRFSDAFVSDLLTGALLRISVDATGRQMGGASFIAGNGGFIALPLPPSPAIARFGSVVTFNGVASLWNVYGGYAPSDNLYTARIPPANIVLTPAAPLVPGGDGRDNIGQAVASSPEFLVIGAPNGGPGADGPGEVYVYARTDLSSGVAGAMTKGAATPVAVLRDGGGQIGDKFGRSVAISPDGRSIVIGQPGRGTGRALVFEKPVNGPWTNDSIPDATLLPQPGANDVVQEFGSSASFGPDGLILIGAPKSDVGGLTDAGLAFGYKSNSVSRLAPPTPTSGGEFGSDIDQSGSRVVIGEPGDLGGAIHLFDSQPNGTLPVAEMRSAGGQIGDKFGQSVGIDGDTLVIGRPGRGSGNGGAVVFERPEGNVLPVEVAELVVTDAGQSAAGSSVDIANGLLLVGAPLADVNGVVDQGRVYFYERPDGGFSGTANPSAAVAMLGGAANDQFGSDVNASSGDAYVGVPLRDVDSAALFAGASAKGVLADQGVVLPYRLDRLFRNGFD
jgi:Tol biopolymer transport system component